MLQPNRRTFMMGVVAGGSALHAVRCHLTGCRGGLDRTDPQAVALGFKADSTKVDKAKYPQHTQAQVCGGCNFFQGKPADATAPCQLFRRQAGASKGWCSAWAKKA